MCGRFTLRVNSAAVAQQFQLAGMPELAPHYNVAPTQPVATVRRAADGEREPALLRWGLVPAWAKELSIGAKLINARAETVAEKPAFRSAFQRRRCLVLADGFYEWQAQGKRKQPFFFQVGEGALFGFAGLWERWRGQDGAVVESCTIITTAANELLAPIHERMPVIIAPADYALWLDPSVTAPEPLLDLLRPYPAEAMSARPVSPRVNSVANNDPGCIAPL